MTTVTEQEKIKTRLARGEEVSAASMRDLLTQCIEALDQTGILEYLYDTPFSKKALLQQVEQIKSLPSVSPPLRKY